jgi:hypothetical protein
LIGEGEKLEEGDVQRWVCRALDISEYINLSAVLWGDQRNLLINQRILSDISD